LDVIHPVVLSRQL